MATLMSTRALAGARAFMPSTHKARRGPAPLLARRDSFMVEVEIAEDEPEDVAVRRYMKAVMQSGVINKLRALRRKESKIETYKRKLQERAQARRLGIVEPTWDEFYGENSLFDNGMGPFDDFFRSHDDIDIFDSSSLPILDALDYPAAYDANAWGYQGGYQPNSAYGSQQQQAAGWAAPAAAGAPGAAPAAGAAGAEVFDLNSYEQQSGGYMDGQQQQQQQQQQQPNGYNY
ncbi:MAG: hypothetical protein J3K34DRAFT_521278 [Monoraphidium minutum]|nr:MAG: hypothetical protein J3K34DRAFT_521278 [Monoraphidium minutum]